MPAPALSLCGITVRFGPVTALDTVPLDLPSGARHAVVGENGAGKSTLMKVLFGLIRPDAGQVLLDGAPVTFSSPADAIRRGIGMVHQHFDLIGAFTVAENVVLGAEPRRGPFLDRKAAEERVARLAQESGLAVDPRAPVETLSVAGQQRVEILKALYRNASVLILDEPTAVLAPGEARALWQATERLAAAGTTLVFITHRLDEALAQAETVTVLRRGRHVLTARAAATDAGELARAMVGETDRDETGPRAPHPTGRLVLSTVDLQVRGSRGEIAVQGASLEARAGEIVGLAGVDGSGQREFLETLLGLRAAESGTITLEGERIETLSIGQRRRRRLAAIPEDRQRRAVALSLRIDENAFLGRQRERTFCRAGGWLRRGAARAFAAERIAAFDIRGAAPSRPVSALSGGNQQKLVLARELSRAPALLLAAQPTRGLDFAAARAVHDALRAERDRGAAILLQSLDLDEIRALSDRVAVFFDGRIVAVLDRTEASEETIGAWMTGASR